MLVRRNRPGENINYLNAGTDMIPEGEVVALGGLGIGIAGANIEPGAVGSVWLEGVWAFPKDATATFAIGATVYWNATANKATSSNADTRIGRATQAAAAADADVLVKLG